MTPALLLLMLLPAGERTMLTTGFCPCKVCCGPNATGVTASGRPAVGKLVAGPRWMPLGTVVYVPGYGRAVVADYYARRLSDRLDLLYPTHQQAKQHGAKRVKVTIYGKGRGR